MDSLACPGHLHTDTERQQRSILTMTDDQFVSCATLTEGVRLDRYTGVDRVRCFSCGALLPVLEKAEVVAMTTPTKRAPAPPQQRQTPVVSRRGMGLGT